MSTLTATIQADTSGFKSAIEKARTEIAKFEKSNKQLSDTLKKENHIADEQIKIFKKSTDNLAKAINGSKSYKQQTKLLTDEIQRLKTQWSGLSDVAKKSDFGKAMTQSIRQAQTRLDELRKTMTQTQTITNMSGNSFTSLGSTLARFAPQMLSITAATKLIGDTFRQNETYVDTFNRSISGLTNTFKTFASQITSSGPLNFGQLITAFQTGQQKYNAEDALGSFLTLNTAWKSNISASIASLQERKASGEKISDIEFNRVKKDIDDFYNKYIQYVKERNTAAEKAITNDDPMMRFLVRRFKEAKDKNEYLNNVKSLIDKEWRLVSKTYSNAGGTYTVQERHLSEKGQAYQRFVDMEQQLVELSKNQGALADVRREASMTERQLNRVFKPETADSPPVLTGLKKLEESLRKVQDEIMSVPTSAEFMPKRMELLRQEEELTKQIEALKNPMTLNAWTKVWSQMMNESNQLKSSFIPGTEAYENAAQNLAIKYKKMFLPEDWLGYFNVPDNRRTELDEYIKDINDSILDEDALRAAIDRLNSFLKEAGGKVYYGIDKQKFFFEDYKPSTKIEETDYSMHIQGINGIASAWSNLGSVMGGTGSIAQKTMSAMANSLTSFTNMFVQLQKIQFQAAQAGALAEGTGNAMKLPFPYSLAAAGTVVATVMSMFANFKSIGSFANGGIISGANSIGDMNIAKVNSGEMILNGTQQKHLFNMLNRTTNTNTENASMSNVEFHIKGQDLVGVFNNYNKKMGRVR